MALGALYVIKCGMRHYPARPLRHQTTFTGCILGPSALDEAYITDLSALCVTRWGRQDGSLRDHVGYKGGIVAVCVAFVSAYSNDLRALCVIR